MPEPKKHHVELGIEFCLELAIALYQLGAEQMDLPHSFRIGLTLWVLATVLALRMFWILPWIEKLPSWVKIATATIGVAVLVAFAWSPVEHAYNKKGIQPEDSLQKPSVQQTNRGNNNTNINGNGNTVRNTYNVPGGPKLSGWLVPRSDPTPIISCAGRRFEVPKGDLALLYGGAVSAQKEFPRTLVEVADVPRIRLDKIGERVAVSMDIFDSDPNPKIIATVEKNQFTVNPNNYFKVDLSRDHSRLVITDQHNVKALSLDYLNKGALRIDAVLYFPGIKGPLRIAEGGITVEREIAGNNCVVDDDPGVPDISIFSTSRWPSAAVNITR
jgi:hypothetical protein